MAKSKKKAKQVPELAIAHVNSTFNNTIISIATKEGDTISWASGGMVGMKGARKSTPFAAQLAAEKAGKAAFDAGVKKVEVLVKGPGEGREPAIRALQSVGLDIVLIKDVTPIPHNGCRPRKRRRV